MGAYKDKNGTWFASARYKNWAGETKREMKRGFPTKREALAWEREFIAKHDGNLEMTFESFYELYKNNLQSRLRENTWYTKEAIIKKKILPYFASHRICYIKPIDVLRWQNIMLAFKDENGMPYSPVYLKTIHNQLSAIFNHAVRFYGLFENPAAIAGNMGNEFVKNNLSRIISYLKHKTNSHKVQISDDNKEIKVEYLLRASEITKGNNESVSRLTDICRTLPIFETYCSDAIKPQIDLFEAYQIPNDAHKEMPKRNIIIMFHQELNGLWLRTIESNYEFETVYEWIDHWLDVRKCACDLLAASSVCLHKLLGNT